MGHGIRKSRGLRNQSMRVAIGLLLCGCATSTSVGGPSVVSRAPVAADEQRQLRALSAAFVASAQARHFDDVLQMLSSAWKARYTAERLARDFDADPLTRERLDRVHSTLASDFRVFENEAVLPLPGGRCFRLVREADGWRIAALEE